MSNSLDPDQARYLVGPDLGPTCLQRLSADNTNRQRVKFAFDADSIVKVMQRSCTWVVYSWWSCSFILI